MAGRQVLSKEIFKHDTSMNAKVFSVKLHVGAQSLGRVQLFVAPWIVAHQAPLSMGFSRQEYWSGLPFPPPGDLPNPGIEPTPPASPALQEDSLPLSYQGSQVNKYVNHYNLVLHFNSTSGFSSSHVWMWELNHKKSWEMKKWCLWTVVLEKTLEGPLDCKEIKPVNSKGNQSWIFIGRTDAEAKAPILWPPDAKSWLIGKDPDAGKDWRQEEKGTTEDEVVGWHHRLNGHEFEQVPGVGDGQGSLACCSPWGCKESDMTEWLNWTERNCRVRELEKARFRKRMRPALYWNRSSIMRWEGAAVRLLSCCTNPRKE